MAFEKIFAKEGNYIFSSAVSIVFVLIIIYAGFQFYRFNVVHGGQVYYEPTEYQSYEYVEHDFVEYEEPQIDLYMNHQEETSGLFQQIGYTEMTWITDIGDFKITAYCLCVKCCGVWSKQHPSRINDPNYEQKTASGTIPTVNRTVAADWDILPVGTILMIEFEPIKDIEFVVEDKGSAVKGKKIDIYFGSHQEAIDFAKLAWGPNRTQATYQVFIKE